MTNGWLNSPTDPAGRLRVLTFTPYIANLGYSPDRARGAGRHDLLLRQRRSVAAQLTRSLGATYLLDTGPPRQCVATVFAGSPDWTLVYDREGVRIWRVTGALAGAVGAPSVSFATVTSSAPYPSSTRPERIALTRPSSRSST